MKSYSLSHLADQALLRDLAAHLARERGATAWLLAHLAEVDARRLFLPAAYPSMYAYCVGELRLSEDSACKRIRAARTAREFPAIFSAVADGALHLSGVVLLAPYLTPQNADELIAAATHMSKVEIEQLLAERFPQPEELALVEALPAPSPCRATPQLSAGTTASAEPARGELSAPGRILAQRPRLTPLAPRRFALTLTMSQELHDKLRHAQELLSHQVPAGDVAEVLERVLDAAIPLLEKRKFASTTQPRTAQRPTTSPRHVPAHVRRAVWERDGGRCTFVSESGHRCPARTLLEYDHVDPVARGGRATVEGIRLRCRAHNQYTAERTFGIEFMRHKRQEGQLAAATRARTAKEKAEEVIPWLRALGISTAEARRAAVLCETIPEASLEQRVRLALTCFGPRTSSLDRAAPAG